MKQNLILYSSLFFIPVHAYIVEYVVFQKENAPEVHLFFDVHTEDKEDTMYPMEKQHKKEFLQFISAHTHNNKVIVEDLEAIASEKYPFGVEHFLMLDWLSHECKEKGIYTVNVDCRTLFSVARNCTLIRIYYEQKIVQKNLGIETLKKIHYKLDQSKISLSQIYAEFKSNLECIKKFQYNKILSDYFEKQLAILTKRFKQTLGLLTALDKTLYQNVTTKFKTKKQRKVFLEKLENLDNEFVDMKALIEVDKARQENKKRVFIILGAFHSDNVSKVLPQLGYKKAWSAAQLNLQTCDYHNQKAVDLLDALNAKK
jgi:hypothetical protein